MGEPNRERPERKLQDRIHAVFVIVPLGPPLMVYLYDGGPLELLALWLVVVPVVGYATLLAIWHAIRQNRDAHLRLMGAIALAFTVASVLYVLSTVFGTISAFRLPGGAFDIMLLVYASLAVFFGLRWYLVGRRATRVVSPPREGS